MLFTGISFLVQAQSFAKLQYKNYSISSSYSPDAQLDSLLQTYRAGLGVKMNEVIGFSTSVLYKKQPYSDLGNFMADCLKESAAKAFHMPVDVALVNYGGIRSYLPKGDITINTIYELMPFDNVIVLQKIKGNTLQQLLNLVAAKGGWPVAGVTMNIKWKQAVDIKIQNMPLVDTAVYTLAVSDYLANGGEQCAMLKALPQTNINYLFRDALIDYVKSFTLAAKPISTSKEKRIQNVEE